jgi:hypothetical protein
MDAPKCRLCGAKHWGMCDGRARAERNVSRVRDLVPTVPAAKVSVPPEISVPVSVPKKKGGRPKKADTLTPAQRKTRWKERKAKARP